MSNANTDFELARILGWRFARPRIVVDASTPGNTVLTDFVEVSQDGPLTWHRFNHLRPDVIWPVAERFNCFPDRCADGRWSSLCILPSGDEGLGLSVVAATAVALAVIGAHKNVRSATLLQR